MRYITALDILANKEIWSIERDVAQKACKECLDCKRWRYKNTPKCPCFAEKDLKT